MQRMEKAYRRFMKNRLDWLEAEEFQETDHRCSFSMPERSSANNALKLHRTRITHLSSMPFPDTLIVKDRGTGEVYMCGETRFDSEGKGPYVGITVGHKVTPLGPGTGTGIATVVRRVPSGPADNPGWLDSEREEQHYADIQYSASSQEPGTYQLEIGTFSAYFTRVTDLRRYDIIHLNGYTLRVTDTYPESGLLVAVCDAEGDDRVNMVYIRTTERRYDFDAAKWIEGQDKRYNVTAAFSKRHDTSQGTTDSTDYWDIRIDHDAIGIVPKGGDFVEFEGRRLEVTYVEYEPGNRQYLVRAR